MNDYSKEKFWSLLEKVIKDYVIEDDAPIAIWMEENVKILESKYGKDVILEYPNKRNIVCIKF